MGRIEAALIFEALATGCPTVAAFLSIHNMCAWMVDAYGSDEQRARFLPGLTAMDTIASYCLTEPGSGSDAAALRTRAERDGDHYVLHGEKQFIRVPGAATSTSAWSAPARRGRRASRPCWSRGDTPGLSFGANERKMGWNAQPTRAVRFDGCRVPVANRLGAEGEGFRIAMSGLDGGGSTSPPARSAGAQSALDKALAYMGDRRAFGAKLTDFQALQFRLADMQTP